MVNRVFEVIENSAEEKIKEWMEKGKAQRILLACFEQGIEMERNEKCSFDINKDAILSVSNQKIEPNLTPEKLRINLDYLFERFIISDDFDKAESIKMRICYEYLSKAKKELLELYHIHDDIRNMQQSMEKLIAELPKQQVIEVGEQENFEENNLIQQVKDIKTYFVKTVEYERAEEQLEKNNIVLIIGNSGYGKSDASKVLAVEHRYDYSLRWIEGTDDGRLRIENMFDLIKSDYRKKEIIVFDDFLGKTKLNENEGYLLLINELIKYISQNPNKKLILNSRKTIFQDAQIQSKIFKSYLNNEIKVIDLRLVNKKENYEMMVKYAHIYDMQQRMETTLHSKMTMNAILQHQNFSPLIVKRVFCSCSEDNKNIEEVFFDMLDNPDDIWESEIEALNSYSKLYLNILYSLSDVWIKREYVDEAFRFYVEKSDMLYSENIEKTVQRLNNLVQYDENKRITFCHPSIIDYLKKELSDEESQKIVNYALYFDQIERLDNGNNFIRGLYNDMKRFSTLKVLPYSIGDSNIELVNWIGIKYLDYMVRLNIRGDEALVVSLVETAIKCYGRILLLHSAEVILRVLPLAYDFSKILNNEEYVRELLSCLDYETIWELLEIICHKSGEFYDFSLMKPYVQQEIMEKINDALGDRVNEYILDNAVDYVVDYYEELEEGEEFYYDDAAQMIVDEICEDIDMDKIIMETQKELLQKHNLINCDDVMNNYDIGLEDAIECIKEFLKAYVG